MMKRLFPTLVLVALALACVRTRRWASIIQARKTDPAWKFDAKPNSSRWKKL